MYPAFTPVTEKNDTAGAQSGLLALRHAAQASETASETGTMSEMASETVSETESMSEKASETVSETETMSESVRSGPQVAEHTACWEKDGDVDLAEQTYHG